VHDRNLGGRWGSVLAGRWISFPIGVILFGPEGDRGES
jgi:hypothetical protein